MALKVYDAVRFGAVGDGTADDTAALQAAIDRASSDGGGSVFLPYGTYKITEALTLKSSVDIHGATPATTIKFSGTGDSCLLDGDTQARFTITNLTLEGNRQTVNDATTTDGIDLDGCYFYKFENVRIRECKDAINLASCYVARFHGCIASTCEGYFVRATGTTSNTFESCFAWGTGGVAHMTGCVYCTFICQAGDHLSAGNHPSDPFGGSGGSGGDYQAPTRAYYFLTCNCSLISPGMESGYSPFMYAEASRIYVANPRFYGIECHKTSGTWRFLELRGTSECRVNVFGAQFIDVTNEVSEDFTICGLYVETAAAPQKLTFDVVPAIDASFGAYKYTATGIYEMDSTLYVP